jgi:hypothetical protein
MFGVNLSAMESMQHFDIYSCFIKLERKPSVNPKDLLDTYEWRTLHTYKQLNQRILRGSTLLAQMAHWVGGSVVHESGQRMSWDNLISNCLELVDLWVKLVLESNAIMARFKDGVTVDFLICLIQVHFPFLLNILIITKEDARKLKIRQTTPNAAIPTREGVGFA